MSGREFFDIAVVGGGPVGATLAALLAGGTAAGRRVLLLEREPPPAATEADHEDLRVFALSRASERILRAAGVWAGLKAAGAQPSPYERMHVWLHDSAPRGTGSLTFDAAELGEADLGCIVGNEALQRAALAALPAAGVEMLAAAVDDIRFEPDRVLLETTAGACAARLVVGADGGRSVVRRAAGFALETQDYGQLGIVANVHSERPHERTAWQRFLGDGTLALLPLADGRSSLVWSLPRARAEALLCAEPRVFDAELTAASAGVLGELRLGGARRSFPLRRMNAPRYVRERCALVGDAAHTVHPLAGQGFNLGLLDAATLAEVLETAIAGREDPGALRLLRRYERWRKSDNETMGIAMDLLNRFLAFGDGSLGAWAARGIDLVGRSQLLRRPFAERALGLAGGLPLIARRG